LNIFVSCGEPSGDLYAGALTRALKELDHSTRVFGLGGDHMRAAGADVVEDFDGLAATGLSEALSVVPRTLATLRRLKARARRERPDVFVPIDYPEVNFRLARALQRLGIPVVYYVCPQVWAWRRGRLGAIKRFADRALVIFPFEEEIYRQAGIPVEFVGHPLVELARAAQPREEFLGTHQLDPSAPTVALLPGSRPNEVRTLLPELLASAALVAQRVPDVQFVVARAPYLDDRLFAPLRQDSQVTLDRPVVVVESQTDDVVASSDVVVTASGTATVQTAIHGRPMVIVYRLSPLTYRLVRRFAHVDMAGMVNLIAGEKVAPELLQDDLTPEAVADAVVGLLTDPARARDVGEALSRVRARLGAVGASRRAAEAIYAVASSRRGTVRAGESR
jgi:lipid-A-disaccharide synthase